MEYASAGDNWNLHMYVTVVYMQTSSQPKPSSLQTQVYLPARPFKGLALAYLRPAERVCRPFKPYTIS